MMHKAWSSIDEVPYCFWRSYVKFQGHTAQKIIDFDPNWAFPDCNSCLNSQMAMKCCTKLETAKERCPIVFQGHPSNFKVTRYKTSPILTQIGRFRTIGQSQLSNPSDLPCFCQIWPNIDKKVIEFRTNDSFICNKWPIIQLKFGIDLGSFVLVYNAFKYLPSFKLRPSSSMNGSVRPSVRPSVRLSVCLSVCHTFLTMFPSSYHHKIFGSYYQWQKWRPCKRSRSEVKGQGHRGHNPTLPFPDCNSSLNSRMMMKWCI